MKFIEAYRKTKEMGGNRVYYKDLPYRLNISCIPETNVVEFSLVRCDDGIKLPLICMLSDEFIPSSIIN